MVVGVDRAADIRQLLRWSAAPRRAHRDRRRRRGVEARAATRPRPRCRCSSIRCANLPSDFDQIGATMDNAARLRAAGVRGRLRAGRRRLAQRAQDPPARRQRGRQRPALGRWPGRPDRACRREALGVGDALGTHRAGQARRPGAVERRSAGGQHASRLQVWLRRPRDRRCARARPNCATATCAPRRRPKRRPAAGVPGRRRALSAEGHGARPPARRAVAAVCLARRRRGAGRSRAHAADPVVATAAGHRVRVAAAREFHGDEPVARRWRVVARLAHRWRRRRAGRDDRAGPADRGCRPR